MPNTTNKDLIKLAFHLGYASSIADQRGNNSLEKRAGALSTLLWTLLGLGGAGGAGYLAYKSSPAFRDFVNNTYAKYIKPGVSFVKNKWDDITMPLYQDEAAMGKAHQRREAEAVENFRKTVEGVRARNARERKNFDRQQNERKARQQRQQNQPPAGA